MKKLLFIVLAVTSLTMSAQNQKIALIEPRAGEGSTAISGMEKAMVRGELRKAIVNHTGFEAFTRADIDQLMKEQDFQRTGNVSESDIHRMGEMSGADYLCISTLNKSSDEFYLEAYLINVETGAISNPASQYGELVNGKLANMLTICQALAQELLGTNTPVAQPVISRPVVQQQKNNSVQSKQAQNNMNVNKTPGAADGIGDIYTFPDGSRGVVFYKSNDGHGLVVSLYSSQTKWENVNRSRDCHDIPALPNLKGSKNLTFRLGEKYTNDIIAALGATQAPAAYWCTQQGNGWYLPSDGELWYLFTVANERACERGRISVALMQAGGESLSSSEWYWSSTENDNDEALNVTCSGLVSWENKYSMLLVRAIRAF